MIFKHFFDEENQSWDKSPGYNQNFLNNQQFWFNNLLSKQGHLFLNEIYDALKIHRTREGATSGWILGASEPCYVDLGFDKDPEFMSGHTREVWLEFDVRENIHLTLESELPCCTREINGLTVQAMHGADPDCKRNL